MRKRRSTNSARALNWHRAEPSFHLSLGISYEQLNLPDEAVKSYEQYLALAPSTPDADKVKARIEQLRKPA